MREDSLRAVLLANQVASTDAESSLVDIPCALRVTVDDAGLHLYENDIAVFDTEGLDSLRAVLARDYGVSIFHGWE